jgi:uncharacterized membrane protein YhiD involved in acid resistance
MQNFLDIIQNRFSGGGTVSAHDIVITLLLTCVLAVYIFFVYKAVSRSVMYSKGFHISMAIMCLISATVVMAIRDNIAIALGTLGALSIARFRTAVKDPIDLVFIFWSITTGIVMGAGSYTLAFAGCFVVAAVLIIMQMLPSGGTPYILILNCTGDENTAAAAAFMQKSVKRWRLKSKVLSPNGFELTYEVTLRDKEGEFINRLREHEGVGHAALVAYDGEYMG